jgi:hypothetical protein
MRPFACLEGAATTYPPSARTSTCGASLPAEFLSAIPGCRKNRCFPAPVIAASVNGTIPFSRVITKKFSSPRFAPALSRSITMIPDDVPVAIPMLASGHFVHQRRIWPSSPLASFSPETVRGCLPMLVQSVFPQLHPLLYGVWSGRTCQPRFAYVRAASSR